MAKIHAQRKIPTSTERPKARAVTVVTQATAPTAPLQLRQAERAARAAKITPSRSDPPAATPRPPSKQATIAAMLRQKNGTTIAELIAVTGWQSHSIRAALTGLRKAGHQVERERDDTGLTRYRGTAST